jgi:hypothetical protein
MSTNQIPPEVQESLARAQSSLECQDLQGFCAAVNDLQKLMENESGQWKSAVNFLARSIHRTPVPVPFPTRSSADRA